MDQIYKEHEERKSIAVTKRPHYGCSIRKNWVICVPKFVRIPPRREKGSKVQSVFCFFLSDTGLEATAAPSPPPPPCTILPSRALTATTDRPLGSANDISTPLRALPYHPSPPTVILHVGNATSEVPPQPTLTSREFLSTPSNHLRSNQLTSQWQTKEIVTKNPMSTLQKDSEQITRTKSSFLLHRMCVYFVWNSLNAGNRDGNRGDDRYSLALSWRSAFPNSSRKRPTRDLSYPNIQIQLDFHNPRRRKIL